MRGTWILQGFDAEEALVETTEDERVESLLRRAQEALSCSDERPRRENFLSMNMENPLSQLLSVAEAGLVSGDIVWLMSRAVRAASTGSQQDACNPASSDAIGHEGEDLGWSGDNSGPGGGSEESSGEERQHESPAPLVNPPR